VHPGDPCAGPDGDANCNETCNEVADNCFAPDPNGSDCNDGDACTADDSCSGGSCSGTNAVCTTTTTTLPEALCGDANDDGTIAAGDALLTLRTAVGTASCLKTLCDYTGDGNVTVADALAILRVAVGQTVPPNCPDALLAGTATTMPVTSTTEEQSE